MSTSSENHASREQISMKEFLSRLQVQGGPPEHYAYKCVRCGHVQSAASLARYIPAGDAINAAYFSCEGCFTKVGGCDWTLGGLLQIHKLEVLAEDDVVDMLRTVPVFEPASPEEAQDLMSKIVGSIRKCRVCGCSDFHACPGGCFWVESDLCSACHVKEASRVEV